MRKDKVKGLTGDEGSRDERWGRVRRARGGEGESPVGAEGVSSVSELWALFGLES